MKINFIVIDSHHGFGLSLCLFSKFSPHVWYLLYTSHCLLPTCILHTPVFCPHSFPVCLFSSWCWFDCLCSSCVLCVLSIVPLRKNFIFYFMYWTIEKIQFSFIKNVTIIYCIFLGYFQNRGGQLSLSQYISGLFNLCFSAQTQTSHIHY